MRVEQAIYTSLQRDGKSGYHVVSHSRGVSQADLRALSAWSPSHGALTVDAANRVSVNYHPLTEGRYALSRTSEGPAEYSGRGGHQLYTHALILEVSQLERWGCRPIALYRDALALGRLRYLPEPEATLETIELSRCFRRPEPDPDNAASRALGLDRREVADFLKRLRAGESYQLRFAGDRIALADCLLGLLPPHLAATTSFSTSLQTSSVRPFRLSLLG